MNKEVGGDLLNLGILFQLTAIMMILMVLCACPLFCFDNELAIKEAAADNDLELAER